MNLRCLLPCAGASLSSPLAEEKVVEKLKFGLEKVRDSENPNLVTTLFSLDRRPPARLFFGTPSSV